MHAVSRLVTLAVRSRGATESPCEPVVARSNRLGQTRIIHSVAVGYDCLGRSVTRIQRRILLPRRHVAGPESALRGYRAFPSASTPKQLSRPASVPRATRFAASFILWLASFFYCYRAPADSSKFPFSIARARARRQLNRIHWWSGYQCSALFSNFKLASFEFESPPGRF